MCASNCRSAVDRAVSEGYVRSAGHRSVCEQEEGGMGGGINLEWWNFCAKRFAALGLMGILAGFGGIFRFCSFLMRRRLS